MCGLASLCMILNVEVDDELLERWGKEFFPHLTGKYQLLAVITIIQSAFASHAQTRQA